MAEEEDGDCCPLCMEELDLTDKTFDACPCGYQVCLWCWHQIKNEYNGLCPACRAPYSELSKQKATVDREDVVRRTKQRKQKEKNERRSSQQAKQTVVNRKNLANVRVMQRNLVYVIGLPVHFADEDILRAEECFGQYGKIIKAVVNKSHLHSDRANATASAYITFAHKEDALVCISAIDGFCLDGSMLRASFGTTKYCNFFLRNLQCNNPDCLYLHELGDQDDSFTKEEMQSALHSSRTAFRDPNLLSATSEVRSGSAFPPRPPRTSQSEDASSATPAQPSSHEESKSPSASARLQAASDAQRKAQSAAAVHKLKQSNQRESRAPQPSVSEAKSEGSFSSVVSGRQGSRSPSNTSGDEQNPPDTQLTSEVSESGGKHDLRVDTSLPEAGSDTIVDPLEALKMATGSASQEPVWAQPFPSPSIEHAEKDEASEGSIFSPFGIGFETQIGPSTPSVNTTTSDQWGHLAPMAPIPYTRNGSSNDSGTFFAPQTSSSSSFASIDAIFSQRNQSSEALADLLGVQMSSTPLVHGMDPSKLTPKSASSSRFAFANQPSNHGAAVPLSSDDQFGQLPRPSGGLDFQEYPSSTLGVSAHPSTNYESFPSLSARPMSSATPLNGHHAIGSTSNASLPEAPRPDIASNLAFLQQMLPNVNISFGGEHPSTMTRSGNNSDGRDSVPGRHPSGFDSWSTPFNGGYQLSDRSSSVSRADHQSPFFDPAIVTHSGAPAPTAIGNHSKAFGDSVNLTDGWAADASYRRSASSSRSEKP